MNESMTNVESLLDELSGSPRDQWPPQLHANGGVEAAVLALVEHATQLISVDVARADAATTLVIELADRHGSSLEQARARRARARALSYQGRFEEALAISQEGLARAQQAGHLVEAGRARLASMHALGELGQLDEAIDAGEHARKTFLAANEPGLAARADINLGIAHQRQDQPALAVVCFNRAEAPLADDPRVLGQLHNSRGEALLALSDFAGAERAFRAALRVFESIGAEMMIAFAEGNLADLASRQGSLSSALWHFERARRMMERNASPMHMARLLAEQAEAINSLGLPQDALIEYRRALPELDRCGLMLEAARARNGMGLALLRLDRWSEAETCLAAATLAFDELGHTTARARTELLRAELAVALDRPVEARQLLDKALVTLQSRPTDLVSAREQLARLSIVENRLPEADAHLAIAITTATRLELLPLLADSLTLRGQLRRRQGRLDDAIGDLEAAVAHVERVRGSIQAERFRGAFLGQRSSSYEWLVSSLLDRSDGPSIARAFEVIEMAKSRLLREQLNAALTIEDSSNASSRDADDLGLIDEHAVIKAELNALYGRAGEHAAADAATRLAMREREARLDELESRLAVTRGMRGLFVQNLSLSAVQGELHSEQVLIEFFAVGEEILALAVRHNAVDVFRGLATTRELAADMQRLQFQINRALRPNATDGERGARLVRDIQRELGRLHGLLIAPMQCVLDVCPRLTIVPHGVLHLLPFAALWNGSRYLIDTHTVQVAPSATVLRALRAPSYEPGPALVVGVADEIVPGVEQEAAAAAGTLGTSPGNTLIGSAATVESALRAMPSARIIHLACHGRFAADSPMSSGLRLGDRWLTIRDLMSISLQADLVTLSGCESGVNLVNAGDELMGLMRGFLGAGASALLATLWRVEDQTTREFMGIFYGLWRDDPDRRVPLSEQVRQAQRMLMQRFPHPAFWACFVLAGRE